MSTTPRRRRDDAVREHERDATEREGALEHARAPDAPPDMLAPAALTPDADVARERLADALVRAAGARLRATMDVADPAQERRLEWLADEARAALSPAERRVLAERARAFASRMTMASSASPGHVREVEGLPPERTPTVSVTGREGVRAAAAERCAPRVALAVAAGIGRELWDEPAEAWVAVPEDVPAGEHVALQVRGDSMEPLLHDGDTILVRLGPDATPGDVVVVRRPEDGYVVKRVARTSGEAMVLASMNAAYEDIEVPRDPALVAGTVVLRWCAHGAARSGAEKG